MEQHLEASRWPVRPVGAATFEEDDNTVTKTVGITDTVGADVTVTGGAVGAVMGADRAGEGFELAANAGVVVGDADAELVGDASADESSLPDFQANVAPEPLRAVRHRYIGASRIFADRRCPGAGLSRMSIITRRIARGGPATRQQRRTFTTSS